METPDLPSRSPTDGDLITLARELNRLGAKYIVVGGFAINHHGVNRATMDIDFLIAADKANQARIRQALEILPDKAIKELGPDEDMAEVVVVRVFDEITVDLMTKACGVSYDEAQSDILWHEMDGVRIPFANLDLMLKLKRSHRAKDVEDRQILERIRKQQAK
ncbi:MAG TPA: nucleotidyl transferase AbiEii/AbiGii toxin family protein [Opitutales bacterium]|nr:nucleotidyl transferase AbiEii/AbiGii toxin family protein [Opitutales bacterium]